MMKRHLRRWTTFYRAGLLVAFALSLVVATSSGAFSIFSNDRIGGRAGNNDARDADFYPAVAFDPATKRYLAVWLTPRNARSQSDGFDVYGIFLDVIGNPLGSEFRISDSNNVARNALPTVAAGNGEFVVLWTARGSVCQINGQRVMNNAARSDLTIVAGSVAAHSPSLVYDPVGSRFVVAYVEGEDYLPPTFFGATTSDCGNNAASASRIMVSTFTFDDEQIVQGDVEPISNASAGAFRPRIAYSPVLDRYLVVWEDRRDAGQATFRFDIYAQLLDRAATKVGDNVQLAVGGDYANDDATATWTPRPVVAGGDRAFLVNWFSRVVESDGVTWSVQSRFVTPDSSTASVSAPFSVFEIPFVLSHVGNSPTGFLAAVYQPAAQEFVVGLTSHLEGLTGYLSLARLQRVSADGKLIDRSGRVQLEPTIGYFIDSLRQEQFSISMAANSLPDSRSIIVLYGKNPGNTSSQDYDIWSTKVSLAELRRAYIPFVQR